MSRNFDRLMFGDARMCPHNPYERVIVDVFDYAKGVPHWLDDRKWCGHDWNYWHDMLPVLSFNHLSSKSGAK